MREVVRGAAAVLLALPLSEIVRLLPAVEECAPADALLLDTGSVKRPVVEAMSRLEHPERAVGGHPIAGTERSGPEAADARLLDGATFVLWRTEHTAYRAMKAAQMLAEFSNSVDNCNSSKCSKKNLKGQKKSTFVLHHSKILLP